MLQTTKNPRKTETLSFGFCIKNTENICNKSQNVANASFVLGENGQFRWKHAGHGIVSFVSLSTVGRHVGDFVNWNKLLLFCGCLILVFHSQSIVTTLSTVDNVLLL